MNCHFATPVIWMKMANGLDLANRKNIASDMAPTAGANAQGRWISSCFKTLPPIAAIAAIPHLSNNGNEVCFCTIGDASTSEGHFWEAVNAAGVYASTSGHFYMG